MQPASRPGGGLLPVAAGAVLSLVFGAILAGKADAVLGERLSLLLLGAAAAGALFFVFGHLRFAAVVAWPVLGVAAYPFLRLPKGNPIITFDRVWIVGTVAAVVVGVREIPRARESRLFVRALALLTAAFGLRALASGTASGTRSLWIDAIVLPTVLFLVTSRFATTRRRCEQIGAALTCGGALLAVLGIIESVSGFSLASYSGGQLRYESELGVVRISGPYPVPEPYALSLVVCLAATLYWLQIRHGRARLLATAVAALELTAIGLTLFRAAWIAAALVVIASLALRPRRFMRPILVAGAIAALAFGASTQLATNGGLNQRVNNTQNIWGRIATYEQGIAMFRGSPLWGVGVNRYTPVAQSLPPKVVHGVQSVTYPHSSYIDVLAEQGLFGFVPLLFASFAAWRLVGGLRRRADARDAVVLAAGGTGAILGYLVMSLTLTMLPYGVSNSFFLMLLGMASGRLDAAVAGRDSTAEASQGAGQLA
jgi:O-antigen ligase